MNNTKYCIVYSNTDNEEIATKISQGLLENKLCACINIDEVRSFFWDNDKIQDLEEYRLSIKMLAKNYEEAEKFIKQNHNYRLPEIIKIDITEGLPEYLKWIG